LRVCHAPSPQEAWLSLIDKQAVVWYMRLTAVFDEAVVVPTFRGGVGMPTADLRIADDERRQKDALFDLGVVENHFEHAAATAAAAYVRRGRSRRRRQADGDVELWRTGNQRVVATQLLTAAAAAGRAVVHCHRHIGGTVRHVTCSPMHCLVYMHAIFESFVCTGMAAKPTTTCAGNTLYDRGQSRTSDNTSMSSVF